eukprot:CAMPEP_0176099064 /NCGR_PEP_ID=MMETSP0120_2-20121206/49678_1 /TAXON_ID=160619 /ORGANISM="Kryptoperidinium foliaceum, Strain CCMP 1326" /LENGTH=116 /DNA_ID=CAMNT_0017433089 /DNA_START=163 /DNA_END=510 /DNA_ORIENTATION=-
MAAAAARALPQHRQMARSPSATSSMGTAMTSVVLKARPTSVLSWTCASTRAGSSLTFCAGSSATTGSEVAAASASGAAAAGRSSTRAGSATPPEPCFSTLGGNGAGAGAGAEAPEA